MLEGHTVGGGLEMAMACDLRFAANDEYQIGLPEVTLGVLPGTGGTQRMLRLVGYSKALDLCITGRTLSPLEALDYGLVDKVFDASEFGKRRLNTPASWWTAPRTPSAISSCPS